jgi:hypothetical protein
MSHFQLYPGKAHLVGWGSSNLCDSNINPNAGRIFILFLRNIGSESKSRRSTLRLIDTSIRMIFFYFLTRTFSWSFLGGVFYHSCPSVFCLVWRSKTLAGAISVTAFNTVCQLAVQKKWAGDRHWNQFHKSALPKTFRKYVLSLERDVKRSHHA